MNLLKITNKYIFPVIIFILLLAFFIWAVTLNNKEGFSNNMSSVGKNVNIEYARQQFDALNGTQKRHVR